LQEEFPDISGSMCERRRELQAKRYFHQSQGTKLFRIEKELNFISEFGALGLYARGGYFFPNRQQQNIEV
jgi:hypothetical protein